MYNKQQLLIILCVILVISIILFILFSTSLNTCENFTDIKPSDLIPKSNAPIAPKTTKTPTPIPIATEPIATESKTPIATEPIAPESAPSTSTGTGISTKLSVILNKKEESLFNDLINNKITDSGLQNLIKDGFLTENLVERYMSKLKSEYFKDNILEKFTNNNNNKTPIQPHILDLDTFAIEPFYVIPNYSQLE